MFPVEQPELLSSDVGITGILLYAFPDGFDKNDFSVWMWAEENIILARLPPPVKRQDTLIMPFSLTTWILIMLFSILTIVFLFCYTYKYKDEAELSYSLWVLIISASLFQEHDGNVNTLKSDGLRLFFSIFFSMTFVLTSSYAGVLVSFLSIPPKLPLMKTMADVAKSPLPLVQYSDMKEPTDPNADRRKILERVFEHITPPTLLPQVIDGELLLFGAKLLVEDMIKEDIKRFNIF